MTFAFSFSYARRRRTVVLRVVLDILIMALAAIMLWRNLVVRRMTMVIWRCEYRLLLLFWAVAGLMWALLVLGSLYAMAQKLEILRQSDRRPTSWRDLLEMSYLMRKPGVGSARGTGAGAGAGGIGLEGGGMALQPADSDRHTPAQRQ